MCLNGSKEEIKNASQFILWRLETSRVSTDQKKAFCLPTVETKLSPSSSPHSRQRCWSLANDIIDLPHCLSTNQVAISFYSRLEIRNEGRAEMN
jgi:hypothetical protein